MDEGVGNITSAIKNRGLWDDTLIIFSADNGAPTYPGQCGNNYPLRGGKTSDFEGGVRASAFVSGGYIPAAARGKVHGGLMHIADWYATLSRLAGVDPSDDVAIGEVPGVDGVDQWASIISANSSASARDEIPLAFCTNIGGENADCVSSLYGVKSTDRWNQGALIAEGGRWKVVFGDQHHLGFFTGPSHPNGTIRRPDYADAGCPSGCLFNLFEDPTEHVDVKDENPEIFSRLKARLLEVGKTTWQTNFSDAPHATQCLSAVEAAAKYGGHLGPQCSPDAATETL